MLRIKVARTAAPAVHLHNRNGNKDFRDGAVEPFQKCRWFLCNT